MIAWLTVNLGSWAVQLITSLAAGLGGWLIRHAQQWWTDRNKRKAVEAATAALISAKTPKEMDDAAEQVSKNF